MATNDAGPSKPPRWISRAVDEIGIVALRDSPRDIKLLCLQRFVRLFAYGGSTLILAPYLSDIGTSDTQIGLFMTLTLFGDVVIGFFLTLIADALGRRRILGVGAIMMSLSGVVFAVTGSYWILLTAAIIGVITPSGNEVGPFRAVEESTIAHLTSSEVRSQIFAWYTLIGTAGIALGLVTCGWVTTALINDKGWTTVEAYRLVFVGYAAIGALKLVLTFCLSASCEADQQPPSAPTTETQPLLAKVDGKPKEKKKPSALALFPTLSRESQLIILQLSLLFAFDNFASGLAPMSWVTYYFKRRFDLSEGYVGTLFFITSIISAISILVAASLARRIGNVKTMVFTHLPSSVCLAMIGLPSQKWLAMLFVVLRSCTQSMDSAPRSAFLAAIVMPNERTATVGIINIVKTFAQSIGPLVTGALYHRQLYWVAFLTAGSLKASYDIGLLAVFAGYKTREDRVREEIEHERADRAAQMGQNGTAS